MSAPTTSRWLSSSVPISRRRCSARQIVRAVPALDGVLHGGSKLSVRPAELFEKEIAELYIGCADIHGVHELLDVVIHRASDWLSVLAVRVL